MANPRTRQYDFHVTWSLYLLLFFWKRNGVLPLRFHVQRAKSRDFLCFVNNFAKFWEIDPAEIVYINIRTSSMAIDLANELSLVLKRISIRRCKRSARRLFVYVSNDGSACGRKAYALRLA